VLDDDGLLAIGAVTDVRDGCSGEFAEAREVGFGIFRELVPGAGGGGIGLPAGKFFVNGGSLVPRGAVSGWECVTFAIDLIGDTDADVFALVKAVNNGDGEVGDAIDHAGVADEDHIEPAAAAGATGGSAELHAAGVEVSGDVVVFSDEGPEPTRVV
jgi:hypothetical protein